MKGHPVRGALCGLLFGLFLALFLLTVGMLPLDSIVLVGLPVLFLVAGLALGAAAPFKRSRLAESATRAP